MQSYDVLVVGCGPVGAVLAARLSAATRVETTVSELVTDPWTTAAR